MQNDRRQFYIYDLEIGAKKAGAALPSMLDVTQIWNHMRNAGRTHGIRRNSGTLLIGDMQIDHLRQFAILLVRLSDKSAPNSVYSDPTAGTFNEHLKTGNVGSDFGCHVFVSLLPERTHPNVYTCAIERIPGLAPELVKRILSKLLTFEFHSNPASFQYPHPGGGLDRHGAPRIERCCPHVELRGRPSESFVNDINNGRLSGVSLVRAEAATPIAGAAYLVKDVSELRLSINRNNLPAQLWDSLRAAFRQNSQTYGEARIAYRVPDSGRTVTVRIDATTGSPLTDLYVSSFEVRNLFPFLAQSARNIVPHLRDAAIPDFLRSRSI